MKADLAAGPEMKSDVQDTQERIYREFSHAKLQHWMGPFLGADGWEEMLIFWPKIDLKSKQNSLRRNHRLLFSI
jgi:hypothetical protein